MNPWRLWRRGGYEREPAFTAQIIPTRRLVPDLRHRRLKGEDGHARHAKDRRSPRCYAEQVTGDASDIWPYRRKRHSRRAIIFHYALIP
jgi:hypothetical protein